MNEKQTPNEDQVHWSKEKEAIKTNRPLLLVFKLLKKVPFSVVALLIYPLGFFYTVFSRRARTQSLGFQKQMKEYTKGQFPKKLNAMKQIRSFSLCILEKMAGWVGKIPGSSVDFVEDEDFDDLIKNLKSGKGGIFIFSHLGNMELMRSLSQYDNGLENVNTKITAIMEMKATEVFNETIKQINPNSYMNVINSADIGPETICLLQDRIDEGGIIVIAGDRTSANTRSRYIKKSFLGKEAAFPYGSFLLCSLLDAPVYFMFALRSKVTTLHPRNKVQIIKAKTDFTDCPRKERDSRVEALCQEFVSHLETKAIENPFQWYNFYNFWLLPDQITNAG